MTVIDTSIWVNHFRRPDLAVLQLLDDGSAVMYPFVVGELACGNFKDRAAVLRSLRTLPHIPLAGEAEVYYLSDNTACGGPGSDGSICMCSPQRRSPGGG